MCLQVNLLLVLGFLTIIHYVYRPGNFCQQQLKFPLLRVNSSLNIFYDQWNHSYPIRPPIKLTAQQLQLFFGQIKQQVGEDFTSLAQFDVIHQGDDQIGYSLEFHMTFWKPSKYPTMVDWTPDKISRRHKFTKNGCAERKKLTVNHIWKQF